MILKSLMGPKKSKCDIPSGTTQGQDCLKPIILDVKFSAKGKNIGYK